MNNRRKLLVALGASALTAPFGSYAQAPERAGKPVFVGILSDTTFAKFEAQENVFLDAMRSLGWEESRNIVYDRVYCDDDKSRLASRAAALVARKPDLIFVVPNPGAKAASDNTRTIP